VSPFWLHLFPVGVDFGLLAIIAMTVITGRRPSSGWSLAAFVFRGWVCRKRPAWRHLVIRYDPGGAFEPGNAGYWVAARY